MSLLGVSMWVIAFGLLSGEWLIHPALAIWASVLIIALFFTLATGVKAKLTQAYEM